MTLQVHPNHYDNNAQQQKKHEETETEIPISEHLPLKGAIVSVSGFKADRKQQIHRLILKLGGRFTNDLHLKRNTHLVASLASGDKYRAAKECASDTILIITSDWIEACEKEGAWVDETPFLLTSTNADTNCIANAAPTVSSTSTLKKTVLEGNDVLDVNTTKDRSMVSRHLPCSKNLPPQSSMPDGSSASSFRSSYLTSKSFIQFKHIYEQLLLRSSSSYIFSNMSFYIIHIEQYPTTSSKKTSAEGMLAFDNKCIQILHKLIRHGFGTRYDELNEDISHFIVISDSPSIDHDVKNGLQQLALSHPCRPSIVTPEWLIACLSQEILLPPHEYPLPPHRNYKISNSANNQRQVMEKIDVNASNAAPSQPLITSSKQKQAIATNVLVPPKKLTDSAKIPLETTKQITSRPTTGISTSSFFSGYYFAIADLTNMNSTQRRKLPSKIVVPENKDAIVSFDIPSIQSLIVLHGGQMLTSNIVEAERNRARQHQASQKKCFVVIFGTIPLDFAEKNKTVTSSQDIIDLGIQNPLLLDFAVDSCPTASVRFILVTPIWIRTCAHEGTEVDPEEFPLLFQPLPWHIKCLPSVAPLSNEGTGTNSDTVEEIKVRVAVTGFIGAEREGLVQMIKAIGAVYTDTLKVTNTHLICKEASGAKYHRAVKWGIHVVSSDWLFHIARYGFFGELGRQEACEPIDILLGCEPKFGVVQPDPNLIESQGRNNKRQKACPSELDDGKQLSTSHLKKVSGILDVSNAATDSSSKGCDSLLPSFHCEEALPIKHLHVPENEVDVCCVVSDETLHTRTRHIASEQDTPIVEPFFDAEIDFSLKTYNADQVSRPSGGKMAPRDTISDGEKVSYNEHVSSALQEICIAVSASVNSPSNEKLRASLSNILAPPMAEVYNMHPPRNRRRSRRILSASNCVNAIGSNECTDMGYMQQSEKLPSPLQEAKRTIGHDKKILAGEFGDDSQVVWFAERNTPRH